MGQANSSKSKSFKGFSILPELPELYIETQKEKNILEHPELPSVKIYTVLLNSLEEGKQYEEQIKFRQKYQHELIQILYGEIKKCESEYLKFKLFIQHLPITLQEISNIRFHDLLVVFHKVYRGFHILFQQYGSFYPEPTMIGFNEEGEVKVWVNSKYSKGLPKISYKMVDEPSMVKTLHEIFMSKVDLKTVQMENERKGRKFWFAAKNFEEAIKTIEKELEDKEIPDKLGELMKIISQPLKETEDVDKRQNEFYLRKTGKTVKFNYGNSIARRINPEKNQKNVTISYGNRINEPRQNHRSTSPNVNFVTSSNKVGREGRSLINFNYK